MKIKIIDEEHEKDLETSVNEFLKKEEVDVIDIKFSTSCAIYGEEQIYCFTALIMYEESKKNT